MPDNLGLLKTLRPSLLDIALELRKVLEPRGGSILLVGGSVRDLILGYSPAELDLEVRGLKVEEIQSHLKPNFKCDEVGRNFGVLGLKVSLLKLLFREKKLNLALGTGGLKLISTPTFLLKERFNAEILQ